MSLEKDLEKWIKVYSTEFCKEAADKITDKAKDAIRRFYEEYTPEYYNRTDDLLENSYSRYYHNNGKKVYGGVRLHSLNMQPYKNAGITQGEIAMSAWELGVHGFRYGDPVEKIYTTPPLYVLRQYINSDELLNHLSSHALSKAKEQKYDSFIFG